MNTKNVNNNEPNKSTKFGLPHDYFHKNTTSIVNKIEWLEEHKAFPLLNSTKNNAAFKIPENYFSKNTIKSELLITPFLQEINKQNPFKTTENYFERNEVNLKINSIGILKNRQQKKHNSLKISYAIAALLILTLGFFIYTTIFNKNEFKNCGSLACIDKTELLKTNHLENIENDELYELVDQKKLEEKLKNKLDEKSIQLNKNNLDSDINNYHQQEFLDEI